MGKVYTDLDRIVLPDRSAAEGAFGDGPVAHLEPATLRAGDRGETGGEGSSRTRGAARIEDEYPAHLVPERFVGVAVQGGVGFHRPRRRHERFEAVLYAVEVAVAEEEAATGEVQGVHEGHR